MQKENTMSRELTKEEIKQYASWVVNECDSPIEEIEWLVELISSSPTLREKSKEIFFDNIEILLETFKTNK